MPEAALPIYDQPNHPDYGPVRRLHVILLQIFADKDMAAIESELNDLLGTHWTLAMSDLIKDRTEAKAARFILRYATSICT
ncbi:hypothetical protein [Croceicoccus gelatinilyticus]|uniref:hypothetical protein n=1 Tax=Croceicoccus gelatinilyticus TaxID=2835536 RepID=UPI001BCD635F|nr:hypothetical protein [Croceicoccus gelatinilyticus]MBS7671429.1 hypothetical protein [Croceicoccus gelatinilyticus]